jgi:glutaredoxin
MKVEIYSKDNCGFCTMAIQEAKMKELDYTVKKLDVDFTRDEIVEQFPGVRTFPIVVVNGEYVGGFQEFKRHLAE